MKHLLAISLCLLAPPGAVAQPIHDLATAAVVAERHDPRIARAGARLQQQRAGRDQALSGYRPDVALVASAGRARYDAAHYSDPSRTPTVLELSVDQPVYDFGRTAASVRAADADVRAAGAGRSAAVIDVLRDAAIDALDVDLAHRQLATETHSLRVLGRRLAYTQAKFEAGDFTATDVAQARARYAQARSRRRRAYAGVLQARARLQRLTGSRVDVQLARVPTIGVPHALDEALAAVDSHPAVIAARQSLLAARQGLVRARAQRRPRIDLMGAVGRDDHTRFSDVSTGYWQARLQLQVPLYAKGWNRAAVGRAQGRLSAAEARLTSVRRRLKEQVRRAWSARAAAGDELSAAREQQRAEVVALAGVKSELALGSRTVVDLLNAQQELRDARLAVLGARYRRAVSGLRLLAAAGRLRLASLRR
jgi:outer membrane protein